MFWASDWNSDFDPPEGSVETSTVNFFPAWVGSVSTAGPTIGGVGLAFEAEGIGDGVGVGSGLAMTSGRLCNSRFVRCNNPPVGPRTTVVSLTKPTPGKNHLSSFTDMTEESSQ